MVWCPSVRPSSVPSFFHSEYAAHTHGDSPGGTCDAASVHFGPTIRGTGILVNVLEGCCGNDTSVASVIVCHPGRDLMYM